MIADTHRSRSFGATAIAVLKTRFPRGKEVSRMENMKKFLKDEEGATAIEYGLIAALIAVAIISAVTLVGTKLQSTFALVSDNLK